MKSLFLASAAALLSTTAAFAQDAAPAPAPVAAPTAATPVTLTDQELARFTAATKVVQTIMAEHQPKIAAAEGAEAQDAARAKMSTDLGAGVAQHGFTVQRYNEIATAARTDQALAARIAEASRSAGASGAPASSVAQ